MTHPILNRVPTVVFRPANDDGPQQLGDAFGPRLAVLRDPRRTSRRGASRAIAIASLALSAFLILYFAAEMLRAVVL